MKFKIFLEREPEFQFGSCQAGRPLIERTALSVIGDRPVDLPSSLDHITP